jgi:hypothetical protein
MNRYNIKIDGEISPNSYLYQELEGMDIFEFDDIEVKQVTKHNWTPLSAYYFPEKQNSNIRVDEYGQVHLNSKTQSNSSQYSIDEFGQVIRANHEQNNSTNNTSSSNTNSASTSSSSDDGWDVFWKVILTIVVIGICIAIATCTNGYGTPLLIGGYYAVKYIWND